MNVPMLAQDKANHFVYASVLYVLSLVLFAPVYALGLVVAAGALKELYDKLSGTGTPDPWDFAASAAGGAVGYAASVLHTVRVVG